MDLFTVMVVLLLVPLPTTLVVAQQQLIGHNFKLKPPLTTTTVFLFPRGRDCSREHVFHLPVNGDWWYC